jgi:hypothetical protein
MKKFEFKRLIPVVNLCLFGGMLLQWYIGAPDPAIFVSAAVFFLLVNATLILLSRDPKKAPEKPSAKVQKVS